MNRVRANLTLVRSLPGEKWRSVLERWRSMGGRFDGKEMIVPNFGLSKTRAFPTSVLGGRAFIS